MRLKINYTAQSFRKYMPASSADRVVNNVKQIILQAFKDLKIDKSKITTFRIKFRRGDILGGANLRKHRSGTVDFTIEIWTCYKGRASTVKNIIYHELGHLRDSLDPKFKFSSWIMDRISKSHFTKLMILWNISIDSRLHNKGLPSQVRGRKTIARTEGLKRETMEKIWNKFVTFPELLKMAEDI